MVADTRHELETLGFQQLVDGPTRFWPGVADSMLDHTWTNNSSRIIKVENIVNSASDHNLVKTTIRTKNPVKIKHCTRMRKRKHFDNLKYKSRLAELDWSELYQCENIDVANHNFESKVLGILEDMAPMRSMQSRKNYRNWIQDSTKTLMAARDCARENARFSKLDVDWNIYKQLRNRCNKQTRQDRKELQDKLFSKLMTWKKIPRTHSSSQEKYLDGEQVLHP